MSEPKSRDDVITELYTAGHSLREIATVVKLSQSGVLYHAKRLKLERPPKQESTTEALVFLGVTVTPATKETLEVESKERNISVSALVREKLEGAPHAG